MGKVFIDENGKKNYRRNILDKIRVVIAPEVQMGKELAEMYPKKQATETTSTVGGEQKPKTFAQRTAGTGLGNAAHNDAAQVIEVQETVKQQLQQTDVSAARFEGKNDFESKMHAFRESFEHIKNKPASVQRVNDMQKLVDKIFEAVTQSYYDAAQQDIGNDYMHDKNNVKSNAYEQGYNNAMQQIENILNDKNKALEDLENMLSNTTDQQKTTTLSVYKIIAQSQIDELKLQRESMQVDAGKKNIVRQQDLDTKERTGLSSKILEKKREIYAQICLGDNHPQGAVSSLETFLKEYYGNDTAPQDTILQYLAAHKGDHKGSDFKRIVENSIYNDLPKDVQPFCDELLNADVLSINEFENLRRFVHKEGVTYKDLDNQQWLLKKYQTQVDAKTTAEVQR